MEHDGGTGGPEPVELILYVRADSPRADAAIAAIRQVLGRLQSSKATLTVCPLPPAANGSFAASACEPPLRVRQNVTARTRILGHITHPELLLELLADCEEGDAL
jgi:hypothetical protein